MQNDTNGASRLLMLIGVVMTVFLAARVLPSRGEPDAGAQVHAAAVLGHVRRASASPAFHSGDLTAVMGRCELDLRHAATVMGTEPEIDIFSVMGDITIRVPDDWTVDLAAIPVFGGVRDLRTRRIADDRNLSSTVNQPRLIVHGLAVMGSLTIR